MGTMVRVVEDSPGLLASYLPTAAPFGFPDGEWPGNGRHPWHGRSSWEGHGVLMLQRPGDSHAIWHFWGDPERTFAGWYVNIQRPFARTPIGYDTLDLELDIWIPACGNWEWKDLDVLDDRVREGRFTHEEVEAIKVEGFRIAAELDAGRRWWDERWSAFVPDPGWEASDLPAGWERIAA